MQKTQIRNIRRLLQSGFTLIELLIVVAIIGILAAVGVPQYNNYLDRAATSACQAELSSFRNLALASDAANDETTAFVFESCAIDDTDGTSWDPGVDSAFRDPSDTAVPVATTRDSADSLQIIDGRISVTDTASGDLE